MNIKGTGCVQCIENDENNKSGEVGALAKDGRLLNKR